MVMGAGLWAMAGASSAMAADAPGCDRLWAEIQATGMVPTITLDAVGGTVRVETPSGFCSEPLAQWGAREAIGRPRPQPRPAPRIEPAPLASEPPPSEPPGQASDRNASAISGMRLCDRAVEDLWTASRHKVADVAYRLVEVYTLDLDNDGRTDDLGFRLRREGSEDLLLRYVLGGEGPPASTVPSLQLPEGVPLDAICFGKADFTAAPTTGSAGREIDNPLLRRDRERLAEGQARLAKEPPPDAQPVSTDEARTTLMHQAWIAWSAGGILVLVVVIMAMMAVRRGARLIKEEEDYDE